MLPIRDHNPSERTPFVTYALIALNVLVFFLQPAIDGDQMALASFWRNWAMIPPP